MPNSKPIENRNAPNGEVPPVEGTKRYETKHNSGMEGWTNVALRIRPSQKRELIKAAQLDGFDMMNAIRKAIDDYIDG